MATAIVPGIYDPALADEDIGVGTEEAFELTRGLARAGRVRRHFERRQSRGRAAGGATHSRTPSSSSSSATVAKSICPNVSGTKGRSIGPSMLLRRALRTPSGATAPRRTRTSAAARSSVATASSPTYTRCRTRPKKGRGDGFACGRRTTVRQNAGRPELGRSCSGFIIRTRIIPPGRRSTISTTRGRFFRTSSFRSAPACLKT